jgi:hypothetical protein
MMTQADAAMNASILPEVNTEKHILLRKVCERKAKQANATVSIRIEAITQSHWHVINQVGWSSLDTLIQAQSPSGKSLHFRNKPVLVGLPTSNPNTLTLPVIHAGLNNATTHAEKVIDATRAPMPAKIPPHIFARLL